MQVSAPASVNRGSLIILGSVIALMMGLVVALFPNPTPSSPPVKLVHHLFQWEDKSHQLSAEQVVLQLAAFQPASHKILNIGYSRSAIWLYGELPSSLAGYWLEIGPPRLEDVRFYLLDEKNSIQSTILAGNNHPLSARPVVALNPIFPLKSDNHTIRFLIRIESRSAIHIQPELWQPLKFRETEAEYKLLLGIFLGSMTTIGLYAIVHAVTLRDQIFSYLSLLICSAVLYEISFQGYLYQHFFSNGAEWLVRAPGTIGSITLFLSLLTWRVLLQLPQQLPVWNRVYQGLMAVMVLCAAGCAFADYFITAQILNAFSVVINLCWPISVVIAWKRGIPNLTLFTISSLLSWFVHILRLMDFYGLRTTGLFISEEALAWALNIDLLLLMVMGLYSRNKTLHQQHLAAQTALIEAQQLKHSQLEQAVTERTQALKTALHTAEEANRAKSDFLARVSHDLRTPLTSITGYADLILAGGREDAERGRIIRRSASHLLSLIDDLIDYARGSPTERMQPLPLYFHALLEGITRDAEQVAMRRQNRFVFQTVGQLPPVIKVDGKRLRQVLDNLLTNAAKFTSQGEIRFVVEIVSQQPNTGIVQLRFHVIDSGIGIAAEQIDSIFDPFVRLDNGRSQQGLGLGLAIAAQWVQRMQGRLEVSSQLGKGTHFTLHVSFATAHEDSIPHHRLPDGELALPELDGSGYRLVLLEDTKDVRNLLQDELEGLGFEVEAWAEGRDFIDELSDGSLAMPDLIVTDFSMPESNGLEVLEAVNALWPQVPVILLSAAPPPVHTVQRFHAALLKPVNLAQLRHVLAELLHLPLQNNRPTHAAKTTMACVPPPAAQRAELQQWLDMGAMSDLIDWAQQLAEHSPEYAEFAQTVENYAERADINGLSQWLAQWR